MIGMQSMNGFVLASGARASADGPAVASHIDGVAVFGFLSALAALACYAHRRDGRPFRVALAVCVFALAAYAFAAGAWPVGLAELGWAVVAARRCLRNPGGWTRAHTLWVARSVPTVEEARAALRPPRNVTTAESRLDRLFGRE